MKPQTIGRVLGIGVRIVGQRLAGNAPSPTGNSSGSGSAGAAGIRQPVTIDAVTASSGGRVTGRAAGRATGSVARGVGGFLKPFRRVGGIVFLEVVGVFFLLFVLVFGTWAWRIRDQALHGTDHAEFLLCAAMMVVFLYLSVSSFWRARRK